MSSPRSQRLTRTTSERLGGPWAISWLACGINAVLASAIFLAEGLSSSDARPAAWLALIAVSLIPPVLAVAILDRTVMRNRRISPVPPVVVIAVNGLLGGLFNIAIWWGSAIAGLPTASASWASVVTVVIMSMWWGSALTISLDYRDESRAERAALIEDAVRLEVVALQQDEILLGMQAEVAALVEEELQPLRQELLAMRGRELDAQGGPDGMQAEPWRNVAERLRAAAQDSVRPLSRSLWHQGSIRYPRTPWWHIVASVPKYQPFRSVLLAGIHMTLTTGPSIAAFGIGRGLLLVGAESLAIIAIASAFNALMARFPRHHVALFLAGIAALQATVPLRAGLREQWLPGSASAGWQVTQVLVGIAIIWLTSAISSWVQATGQLRAEFRGATDLAAIAAIARSRQMADLARTAARQLHGTVQTRLIACAIAIDQSSRTHDTQALEAALREALAVLESPLVADPRLCTVREEVQRKADSWQGICAVELDIDEASGSLIAPAGPVGQIVEEAIANAVRRGDASWVCVTIRSETSNSLGIRIEDDGIGPGGGAPGIGSAIIGQATEGAWSLGPSERGSVLSASLRVVAEG